MKDWPDKEGIIMSNLKSSTNDFLFNLEEIQRSLSHENDLIDDSSESISSADENDIELLMSGEHGHFFLAH